MNRYAYDAELVISRDHHNMSGYPDIIPYTEVPMSIEYAERV